MVFSGLFALGLAAGIASGLFGIGGGIIIVPALLWIFGLREHQAMATSLAALVPPVGLLGALEHYRAGNLNIPYAAMIAAGMFVGAWIGAKWGVAIAPSTLQRAYGLFLLVIGARIVLWGR
jgi:uncharacterized membrane protein YfcA